MANSKKTTAVANKNGTDLVVHNYGENSGAGWENTDQNDFQIPFLNQLQSLSPQCEEGGDRGVDGARPGMFFNSVTEQLIDGDVHFVIALTQHTYVEWMPESSGGGFAGEHAINSSVISKAKASTDNQLELKTSEGNDLVETYKVYALVMDDADSDSYSDQVVISFSKTKIKRYKQIMTRLRTMKGSQNIPLFAHKLVMASTSEKNAGGKAYKNVSINPAIGNDVASSLIDPGGAQSGIMETANTLREAIGTGAAKADFTSTEASAKPGTESDEVFE